MQSTRKNSSPPSGRQRYIYVYIISIGRGARVVLCARIYRYTIYKRARRTTIHVRARQIDAAMETASQCRKRTRYFFLLRYTRAFSISLRRLPHSWSLCYMYMCAGSRPSRNGAKNLSTVEMIFNFKCDV